MVLFIFSDGVARVSQGVLSDFRGVALGSGKGSYPSTFGEYSEAAISALVHSSIGYSGGNTPTADFELHSRTGPLFLSISISIE